MTAKGEGKPPVIETPGVSLRRMVMQDLRRGDLSSTLRRDLGQIYRFYLDEDRRARLERMGRLRRAFWVVVWLLKGMLMRLTPPRRLLVLASLVMWGLVGTVHFGTEGSGFDINVHRWSYIPLLIVLMLELKDKLLARDEIEVARQVQLALLPQEHPRIEGWWLWSYMRPANDVGADLVDYIDLGEGRLGVVLGDVAGKGLGAALLTAKLQATLRALLPGCRSLSDLGARLNGILHRDGLENRFATLFYFEIDPGGGRVRYLNAGHNPPFLLRADGLQALPASSLPLGMMPAVSCTEGHIELRPGDLLVIYSDGLTEARNALEEEFGEARLRALLPRIRSLSPEQAGLRVLGEVNAFLGAERPHDDLSLIVALRQD